MSMLESPWGLLVIGVAASLFWRVVGAVLAGRIEVDTPLFDWCVCVTQAIVGGLMVRAILLPSTGLDAVLLSDRAFACALGVLVFVLTRGRVMPGVLTGVGTLSLLLFVRGM